jgi:Spy/CpxP family protein refolding chaperone
MKSRILILSLAAALGVGGWAAGDVQAQSAGLRGEPGGRLQRAKEALGLTDAQVREIRSLVLEERQSLAGMARAVHQGRTGLRDTVRDENASEADVRAASARLARAEADMAVARHQLFARVKPILTPDQWNRLSELQDRIDSLVDGAIDAFEQGAARP